MRVASAGKARVEVESGSKQIREQLKPEIEEIAGQIASAVLGMGVSVVFTPEFNVWNGRRELRLRVLDVDIPVLPDAREAAT